MGVFNNTLFFSLKSCVKNYSESTTVKLSCKFCHHCLGVVESKCVIELEVTDSTPGHIPFHTFHKNCKELIIRARTELPSMPQTNGMDTVDVQ